MSAFYSTDSLSPRQIASIQRVEGYVDLGTLGPPLIRDKGVCIIGEDAAHNCDMEGADMVLVGRTKRSKLINCFALRVGYCLRCFNAEA